MTDNDTEPKWTGFSDERVTGWYYNLGQANPIGPFATRQEAEQHAKESAT